MQVCWRGLAPIFQVMGLTPILAVQLCYTGLRPVLCASLLKGLHSHTSSNRLLVSD
jgi:hypothetical protein